MLFVGTESESSGPGGAVSGRPSDRPCPALKQGGDGCLHTEIRMKDATCRACGRGVVMEWCRRCNALHLMS